MISNTNISGTKTVFLASQNNFWYFQQSFSSINLSVKLGYNELVYNELVYNGLVYNGLVYNELVYNELVYNELV